MAEIINFFGQSQKVQQKDDIADLVSLLPQLKLLSGESIVISIDEKVIKNEQLLTSFMREVATMKYMGSNVIVVMDAPEKVNEYFHDNYGIDDKLDNEIVLWLDNQYDIIDVLLKHNGLNKISNVAKSFNVMPLAISGSDLGIVFPNSVAGKESPFESSRKEIFGITSKKNNRKEYDISLLDELLKTNILPIISPIFLDNNDNKYIMNGKHFAMHLAKYLSALKYVIAYTNEQTAPSACIYGCEKAEKISKNGSFSKNVLNMFDASVKAVQSGVQGAHIIDVAQVSLIEEVSSDAFGGMFIYDDSINHL